MYLLDNATPCQGPGLLDIAGRFESEHGPSRLTVVPVDDDFKQIFREPPVPRNASRAIIVHFDVESSDYVVRMIYYLRYEVDVLALALR